MNICEGGTSAGGRLTSHDLKNSVCLALEMLEKDRRPKKTSKPKGSLHEANPVFSSVQKAHEKIHLAQSIFQVLLAMLVSGQLNDLVEI